MDQTEVTQTQAENSEAFEFMDSLVADKPAPKPGRPWTVESVHRSYDGAKGRLQVLIGEGVVEAPDGEHDFPFSQGKIRRRAEGTYAVLIRAYPLKPKA